MTLKVLSLFSGVGGFDLGLERASMQTVYQCEIDKNCRAILDKHWPLVPKWDDITTLTGQEILSKTPIIDVVAWGSPCQDLSVAGKRAGLAGEKSNLFYEGIRIINELRKATNGQYPAISIWENVAGALNSNSGNDFGVILDEMAKSGAVVIEWGLLDAQYFGIPQRRRRVFVVAIFNSRIAERCPDPLLPIAKSLRGNTKTNRETRENSAKNTRNSFKKSSVGLSFVKSSRAQSADGYETWKESNINPTLNSFDLGDIRTTTAIVFENSYRDGVRIAKDNVTQTLQADMGTGGNKTPMVVQESIFAIQGNLIGREPQNGPGGKGYSEIDEPMFTLTSTDVHAIAQNKIRRLTPKECERLQGWPDDHTRWRADGKEQTDGHRYKQCGNGVASPVATWIGEQIVKVTNRTKEGNK